MQRSRYSQHGFTLFETVVALGILGTAVVAIIAVMATTMRTGARSRENVVLLQLARAQVETIKSVPFDPTPANYPTIAAPEGYAISFTSTDPGTTYSYQSATPTVIAGSVQQITVTAAGDNSSLDLTFYKIDTP